MKLINLAHSPFAARVRTVAYAKGIELEYLSPEGFRTPEFKQFNILGKVPGRDTGEQLMPESSVIMDYLESKLHLLELMVWIILLDQLQF